MGGLRVATSKSITLGKWDDGMEVDRTIALSQAWGYLGIATR